MRARVGPAYVQRFREPPGSPQERREYALVTWGARRPRRVLLRLPDSLARRWR